MVNTKIKNLLINNREFSIAILFLATSLIVYDFFPVLDVFQQIITMLVFFVLLPFLFYKFILKGKIGLVGFTIGDYKNGMKWVGSLLIVNTFIFWFISYYFDFFNRYAVPNYIIKDFDNFLIYEFLIVIPFILIYEFYFRSFVMSILKVKFGYWSILIQALVFLLLILNSSGGIISFVPYLIFAPFAGIITEKSRSILYSSVAQFIILLVINLIVIKRID